MENGISVILQQVYYREFSFTFVVFRVDRISHFLRNKYEVDKHKMKENNELSLWKCLLEYREVGC